mmetsp:Transcript_19501/g.28354  ORF Transcript_19501/g.28354 Transcript_19501/m.28354 type:complete len:100 (-) Transcript_19501:392-691(-)
MWSATKMFVGVKLVERLSPHRAHFNPTGTGHFVAATRFDKLFAAFQAGSRSTIIRQSTECFVSFYRKAFHPRGVWLPCMQPLRSRKGPKKRWRCKSSIH